MACRKGVFLALILTCLIGPGCGADEQVHIQQPFSSSRFCAVPFWDSMEWKRSDSGDDFRKDADVKIAEQNFSRFCEMATISQIPNCNLPPDASSIPPTLHFIWLGSALTQQVKTAVASWEKHHPGWKVEMWTDERVCDFPWTHPYLRDVFEEASTWAEKADVLRLDILYQFGGIYSDIDVMCLRSFHDLIVHDVTFFSCFELNYTSRHYGVPFFVGTAVMGCAKGSAVMKYCLEHCKAQKDAPGVGILKRTGPGLVSRACQANFANPQENILILPCSYLYPFPWLKREDDSKKFIAPESLAIHLWDYSWKP